jgi:FolB domain-containing protein
MHNTTKIIIRDFKLPARIGIYPQEHLTPQEICVNVTMELADAHILHDQIEDTVSYEDMVHEIRKQATIHHNLVESLAEHLSHFALRDTRVSNVEISVEKIKIFKEGTVGCIITRQQPV